VFEFLPAADVVCLQKAPLVQVIAQVRFGSQSVLGTHEGAGAVHDVLADMYPRLLAEQQQLVTMTPSGSTVASVPQYRMTDLNRAWSVVLGTEQLAVETSDYTNWTDLRSRLDAALRAVMDLTKLRVRERVGLRYINQIPPADNGLFHGRIRPALLGPASEENWQRHITSMIGQVVARDKDAQLLLRVGLATQPPTMPTAVASIVANGFQVDIDCFNDQPSEFDIDETLEYFDQLNDVSYRCFCWAVSEDYRSQLAGASD
jgi:uncharacterized protein (TIGR04255 family)